VWIEGIPNWLVVGFTVAAVIETYFFLMQRAALNVCRDNDIPEQARMLMVPRWYRLAWIAIGAKWAAIVLIFFNAGWIWALAGVGLSIALTSFLPVPFGHFFPMFVHRLQELGGEEGEILLSALVQSERRHGISSTA
jgi:hypothetical protein